MEEKKFFKNIWRFNAIVIAAAGVLAIFVLLFGAWQIFNEITRHRSRTEIVNIDPETKVKEKFELGHMNHITGTKSVMVPLYSDQEFDLKYSGSKGTRSTRNFLFTNLISKRSLWLLKSNKYLISNHRMLRKGDTHREDSAVLVVIYEIVKTDTNKDSRLTGNDLKTVSLSTPEGRKYTEILSGVESVIGYKMIGTDHLAVMYKKSGHAYTAYISIGRFKVVSEIKLPEVTSAPLSDR